MRNIHNSQYVDRNCGNFSLVSDIIKFILDIISNVNAGVAHARVHNSLEYQLPPTYILQQYPRLIPWLLPSIP